MGLFNSNSGWPWSVPDTEQGTAMEIFQAPEFEALAMLLQGHDLEVLGLSSPDERSETFRTLHDFWNTYEIGGVALVDMPVWHWMYDHPDSTPTQLRDATCARRIIAEAMSE
jgi:hypothetical protein